jgi:hypothetical protein
LVVSEKIASLIAQTHPHAIYGTTVSGPVRQEEKVAMTQTLPSSLKQQGQQRSLEKRVSIADPPEQQQNYPPTVYSCVKTVPTTAKTWSEISSEIKVVKSQARQPQQMTPQATQVKNSGSNTNRPISAPTQKQLSRSTSLTRHPSGKVVSNEVDVMAELVPPPPQFAALSGQHKLQIQVRSDSLNQQQPVMEMIRVVNPETGQTHIVHKPSVKAPAPMPPLMMTLDSKMTSPSSAGSTSSTKVSSTDSVYSVNPQSAVARLGVSGQLSQQSQYNRMTAQQQAQLNFLHQQKTQLSQQQFATLSRTYSATQQQQQQQQQQQAQLNQQQRMMAVIQQQQQSLKSSQGSPHLPRAQFAVASNSNQPNQSLTAQGYTQAQQLHFATLSRAGQKAAQQHSGSSNNTGSEMTYSDLNRLNAQARLLRESGQGGQQPVQNVHLHLTQQQLQAMSPQQRQALIQRIQQQHQMQQSQGQGVHYHVHHNSGIPIGQDSHSKTLPSKSSCSHGSNTHHTISFPRKAMINWSHTDVSDWLTSIGMSDHRPSFESLNGLKLLSLDNNHLMNIGIKNPQHRLYLLDKIKQYVLYQQQHPPQSGQ